MSAALEQPPCMAFARSLSAWLWPMLLLVACDAGGPLDAPSESPTPRPPHPFEQTTWSGFWNEFNDPYIVASTTVFLSIDSQKGEALEGFIWHSWGYLLLNGEEIDPGDAWRITGISLDDKTFQVWRTWSGVTLDVENHLNPEYPDFTSTLIRVDASGYAKEITMSEQEYIDRLPE